MLFLTQSIVPSQVVCLGYETFARGMLPISPVPDTRMKIALKCTITSLPNPLWSSTTLTLQSIRIFVSTHMVNSLHR